jgi:pyruvate,water dikinase
MAYRAREGIDPAGVALAVVVQRMVDADESGVMFTANPATGRRDDVLISAAWGLGESVVGGTVTTDDLIVDKQTRRVRSRSTADKAVMTVPTGAGTEERPVPAEQRTRSVLDDAAAAELAGLGARIEDRFGGPQDVEWARADGVFWIVQSRPITALPEPAAEPPTDWSVPDPSAYYARASIVEQLPDPLSPLFADLVDASVTRSLQGLFRELLGEDVVRDGEIGLPTINGYAYYRYARSGLWRMMRRLPIATKELIARGEWNLRARWRIRTRATSASCGVGPADRWASCPTGS